MRKELVREVPFGKSIASIRVTGFTSELRADGIVYDQDVVIVSEIALTKDGDTFERVGGFAELMDSKGYPNFFKRYSLGSEVVLSKVGNYQAPGKEAAEEINAAIREMRAEVATAFGVKTDAEIAADKKALWRAEKAEDAKRIIASAEKEGVENLLTCEELKAWRKEYNDGMNEGGDGYIPNRISKESYEAALSLLEKQTRDGE